MAERGDGAENSETPQRKPERMIDGRPESWYRYAPLGRRHDLTPELIQSLTSAIRLGATLEIAAKSYGIDPKSIHNYLNRGRDDMASGYTAETSIFVHYLLEMQKAEGRGALGKLAIIQQAAQGDDEKGIKPNWTAAAWYLERKYPRDFGRSYQNVEVSGPDGGPVETENVNVNSEDAKIAERKAETIAALLARLQKRTTPHEEKEEDAGDGVEGVDGGAEDGPRRESDGDHDDATEPRPDAAEDRGG
jgi:hypothetical protein